MNELLAIQRAGLRAVVAPVQSPILSPRRPPHPGVLAAIEATATPVLPTGAPARARLALVCHPTLLDRPPTRRTRLEADVLGIVMHGPARDGAGESQCDLATARALAHDLWRADPILLPVGPNARRGLAADAHGAAIWERDWTNLIDCDAWPAVPVRQGCETLTIGRHSRPDPLKWPEPEERALVYPYDPALRFVMRGVDAKLRDILAPWPANWSFQPFGHGAIQAFLASLDVYAFYHGPRWIEAFGYNVLEAVASGLPTVLPPSFAPLFGEAALYAEPGQAHALYSRLRADPAERAAQGALARRVAHERFGLDLYGARVQALLGTAPRRTGPRRGEPAPRAPVETLLAITSNGVGVGHIARQIAIARAQPYEIATVFLSLSKAAQFAEQAGFLTEYRPFHAPLGVSAERWNRWFAEEVREAIAFHQPAAVIFDGNVPYAGLLAALDDFPGVARIWMRRGMWRQPEPTITARAESFHLVMTPGEIAQAADPGHDTGGDAFVHHLPPILQIPPRQRLGRKLARRLLGLPETAEIALLQLGAGANFDTSLAREMALARLLADPARHVVEIVSPIAPRAVTPVDPRHHLRTVFPAAQYQRAFDFAVSAAGYNSFHEIIAGALPCLFTPNDAPEMDLQEARASYAALAGWALAASARDPYALDRGLRALLDPERRAGLAAGCAAVRSDWNGAEIAARLATLVARQTPAARR
ncbi:hypothetical protein [uncultured Amaricoccus sp.]|uniref:hypothetical protein n=1 Tax=uncultured Amaricoccus sp. TaxID=339341 RepID=UPI00262453C8|nr:hypothetical protein [uncultured Amaricoccus sp.]